MNSEEALAPFFPFFPFFFFNVRTPMIPSTSYSPGKAFINFAHEFFEALAIYDYGTALRKIDISNGVKWSKKTVMVALGNALEGAAVCSAKGIEKSANPRVESRDGEFILIHRIPADGKWSNAVVVFRFVQRPDSGYFYTYIDDIMSQPPASADGITR